MSVQYCQYIPESVQKVLFKMSVQGTPDRKHEVVEFLGSDEPAKSRDVELDYTYCTWFDGCYYCLDAHQNWHQVKCYV
ncbi:hypothetical protein DO97_21135 [Neosynechococcus sphagnicola sy1]|uniref:Uncharacterized protein n=1 Tax=Neosynechococcus sphagnicola sy1 TaxID=1497020 RepID=A0A098TN73_9CYAN|nr:hypothetical protein [Neosynechococcus sphagnicola]KGF73322.1 hypothetical protein DO97_21135 [Neosynechococcus sphagnicola sy1]